MLLLPSLSHIFNMKRMNIYEHQQHNLKVEQWPLT